MKKIITSSLTLLLLSGCASVNAPAPGATAKADASDTVHPLSQAVKWQSESKEYKLITSGIYRLAERNLKTLPKPEGDWVVIFDVDETLLDNSGYQREREAMGKGYSSQSWADWVRREEAGPVPGAISYVKAVLAAGGRIGLITNRPQSLDRHTWANLKAVGFPVDEANACLTGRNEGDKASVADGTYPNDKDKRRVAMADGQAECFTNGNDVEAVWKVPQSILVQVGDNIEDIKGTLQHDADVDAILPHWGTDIVILPNPMYGSW